MRRHQRRRAALQQPRIRRERHDRAKHNQIGQTKNGLQRNRRPLQPVKFSRNTRACQQHNCAADQRHRRARHRVVRQLHFRRDHHPRRPRRRPNQHRHHPQQASVLGGNFHSCQDRYSHNPQRQPERARPADLLLSACPRQHQNEHRLSGNQQRRQPRSHVLLRPVQCSVPDQKEECAYDRARNPVLAFRPVAARIRPRQQDPSRNRVPDPGCHQRRNGFHGIADRQVSRSPDHVDSGEGERQLQRIESQLLRRVGFRNQHGSTSYINQSRGKHLPRADQRQNLGGNLEKHI